MSNRVAGGGGRVGRGGGGGGGSGNGVGRAVIPETVRKTLLTIREITGKQHTDEDIYSVLRDCAMDPNETAQKLLYLDTFHEVKSKRDRKKEVMSGNQGRGAKGSRGNHSANHIYSDSVGRRNAAPRRENGGDHMKEKGHSTLMPVMQKTNSHAATNETKASAVISNGTLSLTNGSSASESSPQSPTDGAISITKECPVVDSEKPGKVSLLPVVPPSTANQTPESVVQVQQEKSTAGLNDLPTPNISAPLSGIYSSAMDPVLAPSMARHPGTMGAIKREVGNQRRAAGHNHMHGNKLISSDVGLESPENENVASTNIYSVNHKKTPKPKAAEKNELSITQQPSSLSTDDSSLDERSSNFEDHQPKETAIPLTVVSSEDARAEDSSLLSPEKTVPNGHVIFPNHFKVPEALKSGLSFGSFDANPGLGSSSNGNGCDINSADAVELSHVTDETAGEPSSSNQSISSTVQVGHPNRPESPQHVFDESLEPTGNAAPTIDSKSNKSTQEMMSLPEGHQNPAVHIAPNYAYGIMPHMQGGHFVQFEGYENQGENPTASSSPSPSLSPTPAQNSIAASPQPLLFRPPYPPHYFPYGHYFNPYFLPPMHQFLSHNGLPQQPSTGNPYLTPAAPASGVKFPLPQFKPGTSTGNSTPIGTLYGSFGSSPISFNPGPAVTSGSGASNEDLSASQLKESQIYTTGPLNDVSSWISPPGQDISSLQLNPLYHLTPQGQHLAFSHAQPGHSPYPGIYPQVQTIAAPSTVSPLVQQSQALSATADAVGPPSGAYQQAQLAQLNWNSSY